MGVVKTIAFAIFSFIAVVSNAATMTVAPLPASEYADTEVSTNVCIDVTQVLAEGDNYRFFDVTLSLVATPTNNVEIAFGIDSNDDGCLGCRERDFVLGWDCDEWFWRDRRANVETRFDGGNDASSTRTLTWRVKLGSDHLARSYSATEGRTIVSTGAATGAMFSPQWNMARIVVRGGIEPNEQISVKMSQNAMRVIIR